MEKQNIYTLVALIVLTILTAVFSHFDSRIGFLAIVILVLSAVKFLLVFFRFMEMRKANTFWKVLIVVYLLIFIAIIGISL